MNYHNDTLNPRKNKHLNAFERGQIQLLNNEGLTPYSIGKRLGRASNTIRNELERGTVLQIKANKKVRIYFPDAGQTAYETNRKNCGTKFKYLKCEAFLNHASKLFFHKNHSLDSICGAARLNKYFSPDEMVCTKTLYNYVDAGLLSISNIDLPLKLRRSTKSIRVKQHKTNLGTCISERPDYINDRSDFGHWEIDTVIGKKDKTDKVLLTITERMTRKEIIRILPSKTAEAVQKSMLESITDSKIYFAHPYSSSERGTNERHNGLIRRFIPKGLRIDNYSIEAIRNVQNWCNTLPRKILNYLTPDEAFEDQLRTILYN